MRTLVLSLLVVALSGCATASIPGPETHPRETIAKAEERGVEKNPEAKLYLQRAKDAVEQAEFYLQRDDEKEAKLMLRRAEADAEVALALVHRDDARAGVREVQSRIDQLQNEMRESTERRETTTQ